MTAPTLRPYQRKLVDAIYNSWASGNRNVLAVLPTGGGKSVAVSEIVHDQHIEHQRGVVIAHRNELVSQMSSHIARRGIEHRIIGPKSTIAQISKANRGEFGKSFINMDAAISVAGVDTIMARREHLEQWAAQQSFWVIDEAHHITRENKWGTATELFRNAMGLGVTASPCRADGQGLGAHADGVMHDMVQGPTMRELIDMGALSDYDLAIAESDLILDDSDIGSTGDYSQAKMRKAAAKSHIVGDVVTEYSRLALGKRAICFATDVERATEIADQFNLVGIKAASLSAKSNTEYRAEMIRRFRDGQLTVLVNVDLFGEGFDVPACEVVIMARPTMSLGMYLQQFGRALRPAPNKTHGLIIDHVGNWKRHGFPDRPIRWTLDAREKRSNSKRDPNDLTVCPGCGKPHEVFHPSCPYCGFAPEPGSPMTRSLEQLDGNLMLLDRDALEQLRAETNLPTPADVASRAEYVGGPIAGKAASKRQIEKIQAQADLKDAIAQWAGVQRALGRSDAESYKRFYILSGVDVLGALSRDRSRADYEKLTEQVKGWKE